MNKLNECAFGKLQCARFLKIEAFLLLVVVVAVQGFRIAPWWTRCFIMHNVLIKEIMH